MDNINSIFLKLVIAIYLLFIKGCNLRFSSLTCITFLVVGSSLGVIIFSIKMADKNGNKNSTYYYQSNGQTFTFKKSKLGPATKGNMEISKACVHVYQLFFVFHSGFNT